MSTADESLKKEAQWVVDICSGPEGKVLSKEKEYELIAVAQQAIKYDKNRASYANKPKRILKNFPALGKRRPALAKKLQRLAIIGENAATELLKHNYRLIISIAKKLQSRGLSWEDMIEKGSDGFMYAVARFDLSSNNKLSTYASQWIRQRIARAIENVGRGIRIPIHMQQKINEIKYIYRKYVQDEQDKPSSEEIAYLYNLNPRNKKNFKPITKEEAEELGRYIQDITSLDQTTGDDENLTVLSYIKDDNSGPEVETELRMDKDYLISLLSNLGHEDQAFIKFKYGLVDNSPKTEAKVAEAFQITIKEVKDREARILEDLGKIIDPRQTNLDRTVPIYSLILLAAGPNAPNGSSVLLDLGIQEENIPYKVYESEDKDQMILLSKRLEEAGFWTEIISSF